MTVLQTRSTGRLLLALSLALVLAALPAAAFTVTLSPASGSTAAGGSTASTITCDCAGTCYVSHICNYVLESQPAGVSLSTTPASCNPGTTACSVSGTFSVAGATAPGTYAMTVHLYDGGSPTSFTKTYTLTVTAPFTVGAVTPTTLVVGAPTTFSAAYSGPLGVSSCTFFADGTSYGTMTLSSPGGTSGTATKTMSFLATGSHTAQVQCTDSGSNTATGPSTTVTATAPSGMLWSQVSASPDFAHAEQANGIALGGSGVYVTGQGYSGAEGAWLTRKLNPSTGVAIWNHQSNPTSNFDTPQAVASDGTNAYIAGFEQIGGPSFQWYMEKQDTSGTLSWSQTTAFAGGGIAYGAAVDGSGVYVVGHDWNQGSSNGEWRIEKRSLSTGAVIWMQANDPTTNGDGASAVAVDGTGIYVGGTTSPSTTDSNWRIEKRSLTDGSLIWTQTINPSSSTDSVKGIAVDGTGVYVVGTSGGALTTSTWRIEKRSLTDGSLLWLQQASAGFGFTDAVATDATGIYVVGQHLLSGGNSEWRIEKRSATDGTLIGSYAFDPSTTLSDYPTSMTVDSSGVYVAGIGGIGINPGPPASDYMWLVQKWQLIANPPPPPPPPPPPCATPPPDMVSWWPGNGNANDIVDGNSGTLQNGAGFVIAGKVGPSFFLDGIDDAVDIPYASNLNPTSAMTIDAWVSTPTPTSASNAPVIYGISPGNQVLYLLPTGKVRAGFTIGGSTSWVDSLTAVPANTWTHVATTYDSTTGQLKIYMNGALDNTATFSGALSSPALARHIGSVPGGSGSQFYWNGNIDEVEVFSRALTAAEIASIYSAGSTGKCAPSPPPPPPPPPTPPPTPPPPPGGCVCVAGYGDCNANQADGCEAYLLTNPFNCGTCGHACPAGAACANGACRESCFNGADDDADGTIDQADLDCQAAIVGTTVETDLKTPIPDVTVKFNGVNTQSTTSPQFLSCSLKSACSATETCAYELEGNADAHAGVCGSGYPFKVCCSSGYSGCTVSCGAKTACGAGEAEMVELSATTDAHLRDPAIGGYPQRVCCSASETCQSQAFQQCSIYNHGATPGCPAGQSCAGAATATTNAHGGACDTEPYNVCCPSPTVTQSSGASFTYTTTSQSDGSFGQVVASDTTYDITFTKTGYVPKTLNGIDAPPRKTTDVGLVPLEREIGGCSSGCVLTELQVCKASCTVNPGCAFYDDAAKGLCDGKKPGTRVAYDSGNFLICCEGAPQPIGSGLTILTDKNVIKQTIPVTSQGQPLHVVVMTIG